MPVAGRNQSADERESQLAGTDTLDRGNSNRKLEQLEAYREDATNQGLTSNQGVNIADNQNSLRAGERGPSLRGLTREVGVAAMQVSRVGSPAAIEAASTILADARRQLYRLLADDAPTTVADSDADAASAGADAS